MNPCASRSPSTEIDGPRVTEIGLSDPAKAAVRWGCHSRPVDRAQQPRQQHAAIPRRLLPHRHPEDSEAFFAGVRHPRYQRSDAQAPRSRLRPTGRRAGRRAHHSPMPPLPGSVTYLSPGRCTARTPRLPVPHHDSVRSPSPMGGCRTRRGATCWPPRWRPAGTTRCPDLEGSRPHVHAHRRLPASEGSVDGLDSRGDGDPAAKVRRLATSTAELPTRPLGDEGRHRCRRG